MPREPSGSPSAASPSAPPPSDLQLPVQGRTLLGFGAKRESGLASTGLTLAPAKQAQVVAHQGDEALARRKLRDL